MSSSLRQFSFIFCSRGVIHVGDRLLAINGQALLGLSREDAVLLLKHAHDQVSLQIEYDVCHKGELRPSKAFRIGSVLVGGPVRVISY
jgi:hypothetical protein